MQNNQKIIAIFGAGGFLGKHLMRQLTKLDYRVKVATRKPYLKGYLKPLGNPGGRCLPRVHPRCHDNDTPQVRVAKPICILHVAYCKVISTATAAAAAAAAAAETHKTAAAA